MKEKYLDLKLINKFIQKNKVKEVEIKKEVISINFNFFLILCIGLLGIIIYYKYIEKKHLDQIAENQRIQNEIIEKKLAQEKELTKLSKNIQLNTQHIRNAVINNNDEIKRNENEILLRKKFNS